MPSIGTFSVDLDSDPATKVVALWIKSKSPISLDHQTSDGWSVTIREGHDVVKAVTKNACLTVAELVGLARNAIEESFDLACFRLNAPLELKSSDRDYFLLSRENGKRVFVYHTFAHLKMAAGPIGIQVTNAAGDIVAPAPSAAWQPVLRYYRLSQTRDDIFDAYRYMFLAFEALMFSLWPLRVRPRESEFDWQLRAVGELGRRINLVPYVPASAPDLAKAFVDSQYSQIRLPLFHAKKSSGSSPHEGLLESDVVAAYSRLTRLVRATLNEYFGMGGQSAVFTNYAFQIGLDAIATLPGLSFAMSLDDAPVDPSEESFSPNDLPVVLFDSLDILPSSNSPTRTFMGQLKIPTDFPSGLYHRIGLIFDSGPMAIALVEQGLDFRATDEFRIELVYLFENLNAPKWAA